MSNFDLSTPTHMHPMIYTIVTNRYATLKELRDDYSLEETLALYEACLVNTYNKHQAISQTKELKK